jgi:hypothetical protein
MLHPLTVYIHRVYNVKSVEQEVLRVCDDSLPFPPAQLLSTRRKHMQVSDFNSPTFHPFGMLGGIVNHASEKESVLAFMLVKCIQNGNFDAVETTHEHPSMVEDGLLEKVGDRLYKLTKKSIGLLYTQYGK